MINNLKLDIWNKRYVIYYILKKAIFKEQIFKRSVYDYPDVYAIYDVDPETVVLKILWFCDISQTYRIIAPSMRSGKVARPL